MPIRTNLYQRLVTEIQRQLSPTWTVTESRLLLHSVIGKTREVDVVAETISEGKPLIISIEVRDRGRPADLPWLEGLAKKHEYLPTNKLVVWSPSGFTPDCLVMAKFLGIETVTSDPLGHTPWATIAKDLVGGTMKFVQPKLQPFADVVPENGEAVRWECRRETIIQQEGGDLQMPVGQVMDMILCDIKKRTEVLNRSHEGPGNFLAIYEPPFPCTLLGPDGSVGRLIRLVIDMPTTCEIVPLETKSALYDGTVTTLAEATFSDKKMSLVVRETESVPGRQQVITTSPIDHPSRSCEGDPHESP